MQRSRVAAWVAATLDRHPAVTFALLSAAFFYSAAVRAAAKPFWHDEIYTVLLSGLPSVPMMWAAMLDGVDLAPPLTALLTRVVRSWLGVGPIVTRLVPIASFWLMAGILFVMVRKRANATAALTAALFPFVTAAYRHSYEARAYALMMALFALALYAWAEAAAGRRRRLNLVLLALALAAGLWNHYYAVLAYLPVAAGEAVRAWRSRRLDPGVLAAVGASLAAAAPMAPLLQAGAAQRGTFWSPASLDQIGLAYYFLLEPLLTPRFVVVSLVALLLVAISFLRRHKERGKPPPGIPVHEAAALAAAVLVPVAAVLLGVFATGVFVTRYALPAVAGMSLAIALLIPRTTWAELAVAAALGVSLVELLAPVPTVDNPYESRPLLVESLNSPEPTAITGGLTFLQLWYYAEPRLKSRLVYVADPASARRYTKSDTIDLGLLALSRWTAVNAVRLEPFVQRHQVFRVYAYGSGWLLERLRDTGAGFEEGGAEASARLYVVRLGPSAGTARWNPGAIPPILDLPCSISSSGAPIFSNVRSGGTIPPVTKSSSPNRSAPSAGSNSPHPRRLTNAGCSFRKLSSRRDGGARTDGTEADAHTLLRSMLRNGTTDFLTAGLPDPPEEHDNLFPLND